MCLCCYCCWRLGNTHTQRERGKNVTNSERALKVAGRHRGASIKMLAPCSKKDLTFDTAATQLCKSAEQLARVCPRQPTPTPLLLLLCIPSLQVVAVAIVSNVVVVVVAIRCNLFMCAHCSCVLLSSLPFPLLSLPHPLFARASCAPYLEFCLLLATYTSVP